MIRSRWFAVLLAALAAGAVTAQTSAPAPPLKGRQAFSAREAPEGLVYQIFFDEFMASQKAAEDRRDKGKDDTALRTMFQQRFGLDNYEHQMLVSAARACISALQDNLSETQQAMRDFKQGANDAASKKRLTQLRAAKEAALAVGVQHLGQYLSPERFARLDLMIRIHVTQRLRVLPFEQAARAPSGGN